MLRPSDEEGKESRDSASDKLMPDGQTDIVTPWAPDEVKKSWAFALFFNSLLSVGCALADWDRHKADCEDSEDLYNRVKCNEAGTPSSDLFCTVKTIPLILLQ